MQRWGVGQLIFHHVYRSISGCFLNAISKLVCLTIELFAFNTHIWWGSHLFSLVTGITAWIPICILIVFCSVLTHPCHNFNMVCLNQRLDQGGYKYYNVNAGIANLAIRVESIQSIISVCMLYGPYWPMQALMIDIMLRQITSTTHMIMGPFS